MNKPGSARIAIYLHTLYNGGVERVMFNLIQGFLDRGTAVDLVLDFLIYSPFEKLIPPGTGLIKLEAHKFPHRLPRLVGYLQDRRPDALLSATHFANEIACLARRLARVRTRLVISEHTNLAADISDSKSPLRRLMLPWTTRTIYPWADDIVAVSNGVADGMCRVSGLGRSDVHTIYNPINFARLRAAAKEPVDEPWFLPGKPPVILAIGRLEQQKNFPNLIDAFAQLRQMREARLIILGEGSQRESLAGLIANLGLDSEVSLPGFVTNPPAYMAKAKLFVMSSSWEGMPVSLIEALALELPIVSTDCPSGPAEILDGGKYGELVPMNDSNALAAAMERGLSAGGKPVGMEWLKQFDSDTITESYLELLLGWKPSVGERPMWQTAFKGFGAHE
jgi:glycosyltransferase involved in cell wall biosynthesis